jgi:outer membrane protein TolC
MNRPVSFTAIAILAALAPLRAGEDGNSGFTVLRRPLSKVEALNLAIEHNGTILQAQKDVEAAAGVSIQIKAILFPHVTNTAGYSVQQDSLIEANQYLDPGVQKTNNQAWNTDVQIVQSIYEGGRLISAVRSSRLVREQALPVFESTVADALLSVANAYDDSLRGAKQVEVRNAQVKFLTAYRDDSQTRYDAGAVPEFDIL